MLLMIDYRTIFYRHEQNILSYTFKILQILLQYLSDLIVFFLLVNKKNINNIKVIS